MRSICAKALQRPALKIVMGGADTEDRATRSGSTFSAQLRPMITENKSDLQIITLVGQKRLHARLLKICLLCRNLSEPLAAQSEPSSSGCKIHFPTPTAESEPTPKETVYKTGKRGN
jgi:hypothetical protein